jgi:hypothetical protein
MKDLPLTPPDFFTPFARRRHLCPVFSAETAIARRLFAPQVLAQKHGQKI